MKRMFLVTTLALAVLLALLNASTLSAAPEATFVVRTAKLDGLDPTCDPVKCDLEDAIHAANFDQGKDKITFNIAMTRENGCDPTLLVCTIELDHPLPIIDRPLTIDGYSQPGASKNTLTTG